MTQTAVQQPARRRWFGWKIGWKTLIALLLLVVLAVYGVLIEPARLVERDYTLQLPNWPAHCNGLRLDVVTDTHTGSPNNGLDNLDRLVRRLIASDAQAVVMTGDYLILSVLAGTYVPPEQVAERLKPLTARKPVYAVLGNHDWWKDGANVSTQFAAAGVRMIDNRAEAVTLDGCRLWMVGLGDLLEGKPDIAGSFAQVSDDAPVIAVTHEPDLWPQIPKRASLTVTGHTHGGQINPFGWMTPTRFSLGVHTLRGMYVEESENQSKVLFVSSGIGTSILPMRLGVPPEISRLHLYGHKQR